MGMGVGLGWGCGLGRSGDGAGNGLVSVLIRAGAGGETNVALRSVNVLVMVRCGRGLMKAVPRRWVPLIDWYGTGDVLLWRPLWRFSLCLGWRTCLAGLSRVGVRRLDLGGDLERLRGGSRRCLLWGSGVWGGAALVFFRCRVNLLEKSAMTSSMSCLVSLGPIV